MAAIRQFYKDSTVLISGATGFLGQTMLEKTIRTLQPRKAYLLIRKKKGLDAQQRLQKLMQGAVFDRVRSLSTVPTKVEAIEVDMTRQDLALNAETRRQLEQEVNVVFQLAASVSFNEPLEVSLRENVQNNLHLYDLVKQMKNLQSAMQVSTMYSNCDNSTIREKVYTDVGFGGYDSIANLLSQLSDPEKDALTPFIVKNLPNTYAFAKKCVEAKIQQEYSNIPVGIFRPPGITSTYEEPLVGWINNLYGPGGYMLPILLGLYSAVFVDSTKVPMFAPVDYCSNALLLSAVDVARNFNPTQDNIPVYNYADSCCPNYGKMYDYLLEGLPWPKRYIYRHFMNTRTTNESHYRLAVHLMRSHASAVDQIRIWTGQRPGIRKAIERVLQMMEKSRLLTTTTWEVENANVRRIQQNLDPEERKLFPCDLRTVDWRQHFADFTIGTKKHVLKMG
ncbi:fatty acyl-CoA reductase wat-like [Ochlerotatus camptorhynchus]|uniref:fatty acyl-CoA reductase wat-like n=1 Tax=Ochlerotatus camptorhynchus TaxID=644619 RepID=UPI0031D1CC5D